MNKFMKYELVSIEEHSHLLSAMDLIGYLALSCGHLASYRFLPHKYERKADNQ